MTSNNNSYLVFLKKELLKNGFKNAEIKEVSTRKNYLNSEHYIMYADKDNIHFSFDYLLYGKYKGYSISVRNSKSLYGKSFRKTGINKIKDLIDESDYIIDEIESIEEGRNPENSELSDNEKLKDKKSEILNQFFADNNISGSDKNDYTVNDKFEVELKTESYLTEVTRRMMVDKSRHQSDKSKARYKRRSHYQGNISLRDVDFSKFYTDDLLVATAKVGDYYCTIAFQGVLLRARDLVKKSPKHVLTQQIIIKSVSSAIDDSDLLINCNCGDFTYRFAYYATKLGYKWGKPETRPSDVTNPKDLLGSCCKHLLAILSNKKWTTQIAVGITDYIYKQGLDDLRKAMAYDEVQLPSEIARELGKKGAYAKMYNKQFKDQDREQEELELKGDDNND